MRAQAAVLARPDTVPVLSAAPEAPRVRVVIQTPREQIEAPSRPSCDAAALRAGLSLTPGAVRLHDLLARLATDVIEARDHRALPSRVVFHVPALMIAAALSYTDRHVRRLAGELESAGLLAYGGHATRVKGRSLWDGTLWCVKTAPDAPAPRIRADEWRHVWRDLEGDFSAGRTAAAEVMSEVLDQQESSGNFYSRLKMWAVGIFRAPQPVVSTSSDMNAQTVVYALPALMDTNSKQRAELISAYADTLARHFSDERSRRLYAGLMVAAVAAEHRGLRALTGLQSALARVLIDVREWPDLRKPGALLIARLRSCGLWDSLKATA